MRVITTNTAREPGRANRWTAVESGEGACVMNRRPAAGSRPWYRTAFALSLALAALPAAAQLSGPLTGNTLFFNQASNAHTGNYLAVTAGLLYTSNAQYTTNGSG